MKFIYFSGQYLSSVALIKIYGIMHELPWITISWSQVRWFADDFHEWQSHEWKSLTNRPMSDQKIIHGNECIILFLTCYFTSWTHSSAKNNHRSLILPFSLRTVFSELALWCHGSWSVISRKHGDLALWTSYSSIFPARENWHTGDLH